MSFSFRWNGEKRAVTCGVFEDPRSQPSLDKQTSESEAVTVATD